MRKLFLFMMVSLDGFFEGPDHELDWHNVDAGFNGFAVKQLDEAGILLFGRITYEMMASFWPTEQGIKVDPETARRMNSMQKIVVSGTLNDSGWNNTRIVREIGELVKIKREAGKPFLLLGSSGLAASLLPMGLIDEIRIMVNPIVLGNGRTLFRGIEGKTKMKFISSRVFRSGNILIKYRPLI